MFNAVELVLTMFWSPNSTVEGALAVPDSHLSCLWPVNLNNAQLETAEPSSACKGKGPSAVVGLVIIAAVMFVSL